MKSSYAYDLYKSNLCDFNMTSRRKERKKSVSKTDVTCDFSSCREYDEERMKILTDCRSLLGDSDYSIFTSGIRLQIILMLLKMESSCVCEIQFALNESRQPLISHHLRKMKKEGWLSSERWKKWTFYSLSSDKKEAMIRLIQGFAGG